MRETLVRKGGEKPPLIVLSGPTAAGKTTLSLSLAKAVGAEIISADSMQVYRGMDIGSAKIRPEEMAGIPHHLVDVLDPKEDFNVVRFAAMARQAMAQITGRGKIPLIVGGTGFYIQALTKNIDFAAEEEGDVRGMLEAFAKENGAHALHERLREVDPESAEQIHENNVKRVIRALEFYRLNHYPISAHNAAERAKESPYNLAYFVLTLPRQELYERIDRRVDRMLEQGLVREVEALRQAGCRRGMISMQGLGYKEILSFLEGEYPLEEAVRLIKRDTRHFAKRQLTWFRREEDVVWLDKADFDYDEGKILSAILKELSRRGIVRDPDTEKVIGDLTSEDKT